ncbi:putative Ig domain-containing protein [Streptomyces longisporoflavus]|uniref:Ig domain-containing protein n=1 Tax=Streptomyces longisporoflavus TaxID=28044 RepID=A0ABW7QI19_9ACTN
MSDFQDPVELKVDDVTFWVASSPGQPIEPHTFAAVRGGSGRYTFRLLNSDGTQPVSLPEGLRFNDGTGQFEGSMPTGKDVGEWTYRLEVADQEGGSAERSFVLTVNPSP